MTKQSAVDWLIKKLENRQNGIFDGFPILSIDEIYTKAKEMDKQNIIDAYNEGRGDNGGEDYYNQTFNQ